MQLWQRCRKLSVNVGEFFAPSPQMIRKRIFRQRRWFFSKRFAGHVERSFDNPTETLFVRKFFVQSPNITVNFQIFQKYIFFFKMFLWARKCTFEKCAENFLLRVQNWWKSINFQKKILFVKIFLCTRKSQFRRQRRNLLSIFFVSFSLKVGKKHIFASFFHFFSGNFPENVYCQLLVPLNVENYFSQ